MRSLGLASRLAVGMLVASSAAAPACESIEGLSGGVVDSGSSVDSAGSDGDIGSDSPDTGSPDASSPDAGDGGTGRSGSCATVGDGLTNCGGESCCASPLVTGGAFSRSYDGLSGGYTNPQYAATVADFRLDKYEITVGRFRKFVDAVVAGWTPPAGSGKHTHLNGGNGLGASGGGYEPGWDAAWNTKLPSSKAAWDAYLIGTPSGAPPDCFSEFATWTPTAAANERRPITCANWYQAAAFCIWDNGFLPSEAEWNYAAAGGSEQRAYPWSTPYPPGSTTMTDANAKTCDGGCRTTQDVGFKSPGGDGRYGHVDLAGNVWEWVLDWYTTPYNEISCANCAYLMTGSHRVIRGGSFDLGGSYLLARFRNNYLPESPGGTIGARCARAP